MGYENIFCVILVRFGSPAIFGNGCAGHSPRRPGFPDDIRGVEPEQEDPGFPHAFCPQVEQVNFVLLLGPLRSSGRRALSRSTAPSARRLLRRHGRLENDPDRVRALVSLVEDSDGASPQNWSAAFFSA